jgi:hypothetical protein
MTTSTLPTTHVGPTAEELAKRARIRELRAKIAELARYRTAMNRAFRLPHNSPEWATALRALHGLHATLSCIDRRDQRWKITAYHQELASLRGKCHGPL